VHIRFFPTGTGGGSGPTNYLTDAAVYKEGQLKQRDPLPEVLRGDPARTCDLIDSIENKWKYTSGVIAFHADDAPSEAQQQQVMDDFERLAFAGLEREQYDILWVRHTHEGNIELHMVTPRIELTTGKALNIAPPGHHHAFDSLRDAWNWEQGWARPDDPARRRLVSVPDHTEKPHLTKQKTAKLEITEWLGKRIEAGLVTNRQEVLASLEEIGEITRVGKTRQGADYISVKPEGFKQAVRLSGPFYDEKFSPELLTDLARQGEEGQRDNPEVAARAAAEARRELEQHTQKRAGYHAARYAQSSRELAGELEAAAPAHAELTTGAGRELAGEAGAAGPAAGQEREGIAKGATVELATGGSTEPISLGHHLSQQLGADAVLHEPGHQAAPDDPKHGTEHRGADAEGRHSEAEHLRGQGAALREAEQQERGVQGRERWSLADFGRSLTERAGQAYDRVREKIDGFATAFRERIGQARAAIAAGIERLAGGHQELAAAAEGFAVQADHFREGAQRDSRAVQQNHQSVRKADTAFDRGINQMTTNRADELERFKREINLAEYASGQGYELVKAESSRNSFVMRRESDNDKIIIATDRDGHGVYFSVRDDQDNGSIIDFVQKRQGLNLGEVRKALRPEIGESRQQRPIKQAAIGKPQESDRDTQKALLSWTRATPAPSHANLQARGISTETLTDQRFAPVIRQDERKNAMFAHYDRQGLCGFEMKNDGFTGFAAGGQKGLFYSTNIQRAERVVFTESALDALSHAEHERKVYEHQNRLYQQGGWKEAPQYPDPEKTAYVSFGGSMSAAQKDLLQGLTEKMHDKGQLMVLATDQDEAGRAFAAELRAIAPPGLETVTESPTGDSKDWNDELQAFDQRRAAEQATLKTASEGPSKSPSRGMSFGM
jgi:hypothetical protein